MNFIEIYNYSEGKNLCNLFANLVVGELTKKNPDVISEISVVNIRNFFIVKGRTNSKDVLQLNNLFSDYFKKISNLDDRTFNVIDVIQYNASFDNSFLNIVDNITWDDEFLKMKSFVDNNAKGGLFFNFKINKSSKNITFDCDLSDEEKVSDVLQSEFKGFNIIKDDFSNEIYISDRFYGLSNNREKLYRLVMKTTFHHLYSLGICKNLNYSLHSKDSWSDINNLNVELNVLNEKLMVKNSWLESTILDIFPFDNEQLTESFSNSEYDYSKEILEDVSFPWGKLSYISEIMLY